MIKVEYRTAQGWRDRSFTDPALALAFVAEQRNARVPVTVIESYPVDFNRHEQLTKVDEKPVKL